MVKVVEIVLVFLLSLLLFRSMLLTLAIAAIGKNYGTGYKGRR